MSYYNKYWYKMYHVSFQTCNLFFYKENLQFGELESNTLQPVEQYRPSIEGSTMGKRCCRARWRYARMVLPFSQ